MAAKTLHNEVQLGRSESQGCFALTKWIHYISSKEDPQYVSSNHHPTLSSLRGRHVRV